MKLPPLAHDAEELCAHLLRLDTTNPPGNERPAADYLAGKLREVGYDVTVIESAPTRANLVTRYRGDGRAAPILLAAHLDVVEADPTQWRQPPFSGAIAEDCLWGRGAIDMKNMAAMSVAILRKLAVDKPVLERDVIFAAVADEEAGCDLGSRFLVEQHRSSWSRAEYALGESGGFSLHLGTRTFYPIQVAEKGLCWVRARMDRRARARLDAAARTARSRASAEAIAALGKHHGCRCTDHAVTSRSSSRRWRSQAARRCSSRS
jgi:acetylornithine deacetylase/succinyl-diaminopimelate desuccinylase-like protein